MRVKFDAAKSRLVSFKHGLSLEQASEVFEQVHLIDRKNDVPEQYRAIGWSQGRLCSVVFEVRWDEDGEYYHLVTAWKSTPQEIRSYVENT